MKINFIEKIFFVIFAFVVFFPFIPQVIRSSDTQPLLSILFILYPVFKFFKTENLLYFKLNNQTLIYLILILFLFLVLVFNIFYFNKTPIFSRYFAFIQFLIAIFFGLFLEIKNKKNWLSYIFLIYLFFTFIYFFTNGFLEELLIASRDIDTEELLNMGRGARTLSPEPSFFALHMFNLYVIYKLLNNETEPKIQFINILLISVLLLSSLSGYGFLIFIFLFFIEYTKLSFFLLLLIILFYPILLNIFYNYESLRSIDLIIKFITENPFSIFESDASVASRLTSFNFYFKNIKDNFMFGDNFTILEGGGLIGVISGIGLIGLILFIIYLFKICTKFDNIKVILILFFWSILNFISGPFGIPTMGIIIGLVFRNKKVLF